jgi:cell wall-associated NlpC family hydrolase
MVALREAALAWKGTPFKDGIGGRARRGVACDCISWIAAVLQQQGAIGGFRWPRAYVSETGGVEMLHLLVGIMETIPGLAAIWHQSEKVAPPPYMPGDIFLGTAGKSRHHMALYIGDQQILHSWGGEVRVGSPHDPMLNKFLHSIWRAYER